MTGIGNQCLKVEWVSFFIIIDYYWLLLIFIDYEIWDHVYFVHPLTDIGRHINRQSTHVSVDISAECRPICRSTHLGRHIIWHLTDMSTDITADTRPICWPIHWSSVGRCVNRDVDRYIGRGVHKIHMIRNLLFIFNKTHHKN